MHQTLSHPHIVGLYEVFQDDEVISLVMECCQGGDLFDLIASHAQQGGLAEHCAARVQVTHLPNERTSQFILFFPQMCFSLNHVSLFLIRVLPSWHR